MATTFFRPSLSQGVWITGQPRDTLYYHAMVSNGFNTLNLLPNRLNNRFCYSGSAWWEPWGDFGGGYSDLQAHEEAAVRLGGSYTYAIGRGNQSESDAVENSPIRLSDGTIITTPGAVTPGVTVQTYDVSLLALDLAFKYRGLGISSELYFQQLLGLRGDGPLTTTSTSAFGGSSRAVISSCPGAPRSTRAPRSSRAATAAGRRWPAASTGSSSKGRTTCDSRSTWGGSTTPRPARTGPATWRARRDF